MFTQKSVSETDIHRMLRIVDAPDLGDDGEGLPWSILHELKALIGCVTIELGSYDLGRKEYYFEQGVDQPDCPPEDELFWQLYPSSVGAYPERTGDFRSVFQTADFCTLAEHRRTPMYVDICKFLGSDHAMTVCLQGDGAGRVLRLDLHRGRRDPEFSEYHWGLLTLLRPHLLAAHVEVVRRRRGVPVLTPRQWQLLGLIDAGLSNRQVAARLRISDQTVRKHLENVFARLEVNSRTEALARAFPERAGFR
jgi:DNA-binding CsgD family transcriptional regulator